MLPEGGRADVGSPRDRTGTPPQADQPDVAERRVHGEHSVGQMRRPRLWAGAFSPGLEEGIEGKGGREPGEEGMS